MDKIMFSPLKIGSVEFKNRIIMSPMCQYSAQDGMPSDWHKIHYVSRALGGVGGIIIEATSVEPRGRITPKDLGLWNDEQKDALKGLVSSMKQYSCRVGVQLAHAGRKGSKDVPWKGDKTLNYKDGGWQTIAPSAIAFDNSSPMPNKMEKDDFKNIISHFRNAAKRSIDAGFDFIEIHMAHGYLFHEFLSPITNEREDEYGGSFENRCRFPLEAAKVVRDIMPDGMPLFVRISATDWADKGWDIKQSVEFVNMLKKIGVNLIDVSSGGLLSNVNIPDDYGFQSLFSAKIKEKIGILTGSVGMIVNPYQAEHVLASKQADAILLGRALLYNPYWMLHAADVLGCKDKVKWQNQYLRAAHLIH